MKKLILLFLLLPSLVWGGEPIEVARMNPYVLGGGVAAAGCTLSNDSSLVDYVESGTSGSAYAYTCTKWTPGANYTVTKYVARISASGAGGIRMCLMLDSGSNYPDGTCRTGSDKYLAHDAISDTHADTDFELDATHDINSGTVYWICSIGEGGVTKSQVYHASAGGRAHYYSSSPPGTSTDDYVYDHQVYGCAR